MSTDVIETKKIGEGLAGPGRPKGTQNKVTAQLKDMILQALSNAGGVQYLTDQALENPKAFLPLLGKILPYQVTGGDGAPIQVVLGKEDSSV